MVFYTLITTEADFLNIFKVKCLVLSSYVFYIDNLLGGILIYSISLLLNLAL